MLAATRGGRGFDLAEDDGGHHQNQHDDAFQFLEVCVCVTRNWALLIDPQRRESIALDQTIHF